MSLQDTLAVLVLDDEAIVSVQAGTVVGIFSLSPSGGRGHKWRIQLQPTTHRGIHSGFQAPLEFSKHRPQGGGRQRSQ